MNITKNIKIAPGSTIPACTGENIYHDFQIAFAGEVYEHKFCRICKIDIYTNKVTGSKKVYK